MTRLKYSSLANFTETSDNRELSEKSESEDRGHDKDGGAGITGAPNEGPELPLRAKEVLLIPAAHGRRLAGQLERLARVDDAVAPLSLLDSPRSAAGRISPTRMA